MNISPHNAHEVRARIQAFRARSQHEEHTDVESVWDLFDWIEGAMTHGLGHSHTRFSFLLDEDDAETEAIDREDMERYLIGMAEDLSPLTVAFSFAQLSGDWQPAVVLKHSEEGPKLYLFDYQTDNPEAPWAIVNLRTKEVYG